MKKLVVIALCLATRNVFGYYDPEVGRWLSRDPIEERGDSNAYSGCANAFISTIDILGLRPGVLNHVEAVLRRAWDYINPFDRSLVPWDQRDNTVVYNNEAFFAARYAGWIAEMERRADAYVASTAIAKCLSWGWNTSNSIGYTVADSHTYGLRQNIQPVNARGYTPMVRRLLRRLRGVGVPPTFPDANETQFGDVPQDEWAADIGGPGRFDLVVHQPIHLECLPNCSWKWASSLNVFDTLAGHAGLPGIPAWHAMISIKGGGKAIW